MPNYSYEISTDPKTAENPGKESELAICYGVIHFIGIRFPDGCQGELHVQLFHGKDPVAPTNPDESYSGDGMYIPIREFYEIATGPSFLTAKTWNDSTEEPRGCQIHIQILPREILIPESRLTDVIVAFLRRLRVPLPWTK
jgi:hypothetical protein